MFLPQLALVLLLSGVATIHAANDASVLMSTPTLSVSTSDVDHYLDHLSRTTGRAKKDFSSARVSQAIIEVYGIKTLNLEAKDAGILSDGAEAAWLAGHLLETERVKAYVLETVEEGVSEIDFVASARDYYRANPQEFMTSERVSLRTLLIRTDVRGVIEAFDLTKKLVEDGMSGADFQKLIETRTEDEAAKKTSGKMTIARGDTVPIFESAAFALTKEGQIVGPVLSRFGVHTIQLIEKLPPKKLAFRDVRDQIIAKLEEETRQTIRSSLVLAARSREPEGYHINEEVIHAYMKSLGHEPMRTVPP